MAEPLREIAEERERLGMHLFGIQSERTRVLPQGGERRPRALHFAAECKRFHEPKRRQEKRPLGTAHAVVVLVAIEQREGPRRQLAQHRLDGLLEPRIVGRDKADGGHHEDRSIEVRIVVGLRKRADLGVPRALQHFVADLLGLALPFVDGHVHVGALGEAGGTGQRHPRPHL